MDAISLIITDGKKKAFNDAIAWEIAEFTENYTTTRGDVNRQRVAKDALKDVKQALEFFNYKNKKEAASIMDRVKAIIENLIDLVEDAPDGTAGDYSKSIAAIQKMNAIGVELQPAKKAVREPTVYAGITIAVKFNCGCGACKGMVIPRRLSPNGVAVFKCPECGSDIVGDLETARAKSKHRGVQ